MTIHGLSRIAGTSVAALAMIACGATHAPTPAGANPATGTPGQETLRMPSPSMLPTLKVGSTVTVDLHAYSARRPALGDIIVFHPPAGADHAVPVCGAPREGLDPRGGGVYPRACGVPTRRESRQTSLKRIVGLPGDTVAIVNGHVLRNGVRENERYIAPCGGGPTCTFRKAVTIPLGEYFTLGDNRGDSDDSRFWGPIHRSWIIGKVIRHT
jgi:signal peptidase I